jgi:hypothetical protein
MSYFKNISQYQNKTQFDDDYPKNPRQKAFTSGAQSVGVKDVGTSTAIKNTGLVKKRPEASKGNVMGTAMQIAGGLGDVIQAGKKTDVDMSGDVDYTGVSNTDMGVTSGGDVLEGAVGIGTSLATGNFGGAAIGALKLGASVFGDSKQKKKIADAKERFQNKQRYKSEQAIDKISNETKGDDIFGDKNAQYVDNLRNSPGYNRFKRNAKYNV